MTTRHGMQEWYSLHADNATDPVGSLELLSMLADDIEPHGLETFNRSIPDPRTDPLEYMEHNWHV